MTDSAQTPASKNTDGEQSSISSRQLLGNRKRLTIKHNGEQYTLRITSNNKLILTK